METNLIIMYYPNQNQVNPEHKSNATAISFRWPFSGIFWDLRLSQKGLIFMEGHKMLVQIMHLTIKNMHAKLLSNWAITHPQCREKCQTEKIAFKNPVVIFLLCWYITFTIQLNNANKHVYWFIDWETCLHSAGSKCGK